MTADPYRPNVGIALFDRQGRVFIARRIGDDGPEIIVPGHEWQMPQGGVEAGEDLEPAARRELAEETGIRSVALLGRMESAVTYDWPPYHGPPHRLTRWRGQRQRRAHGRRWARTQRQRRRRDRALSETVGACRAEEMSHRALAGARARSD